MHPVLCISEVLLEIFSHVYCCQTEPSRWEPEPVRISWTSDAACMSRKSLAALARTCRAFHEPAIHFLWAELNGGITPLLGCVPRLHPLIRVIGGMQHLYPEGIEPLSEHEARQFLRHAAHVRKLSVHISSNFSLLTVLQPEAAEICLFPRLHSLSWTVLDTRYLQLLVSPALRRLSMSTLCPDMESIVARCPALEDLSIIKAFRNTGDQLFLVSNIIRLCNRLVNLSCRPLDWETWKHLSIIPTLLTVTIEGAFSFLLKPDTFKFAPFLKLTALSFKSYAFADITTLIRHSEFPSLQRFAMRIPGFTKAEAEQLFHALSQCKACQTLKHIFIGACDKIPRERGTPLTAIRQFLCFTQLETLQLSVRHPIELDNDLLVEAMSCWPHLRSLRLFSITDRHQPTVTFRALFAGLRFCPHLQTLEVMIDAVNIDIDPTAESFQHTSLKRLCVGDSSFGDAEVVARIIFSMLPCVNQVCDLEKAWFEVNLCLESFRYSAARDRRIKGAAPTT